MARAIAMYLPQFYPIPENDEWWGKGYTEWTAVTRARPLIRGQYQPHLPGELGFYDLRLPEVRSAQAELAKEYGIYGFCYYHYWFQGHLLLERPLREVLESGKPDFPFCMCWANQNWTRSWSGGDDELLMEQRYSQEDDLQHIRWLIPYMRDERYIKVQGKPVFLIYRAGQIDRIHDTSRIWREELVRAGFPGLYLIRVESIHKGEDGHPSSVAADAAAEFQPRLANAGVSKPTWLRGRFRRLAPRRFRENWFREYDRLAWGAMRRPDPNYKRYPCVAPGWDNTARRAPRLPSMVWLRSSPEAYSEWLRRTVQRFRPFGPDEDFIFINAWNEWAEGNHLEPDQKWGRAYLEATLRALGGQTTP
jgi:lipopolysaccharide biosynthesis protein